MKPFLPFLFLEGGNSFPKGVHNAPFLVIAWGKKVRVLRRWGAVTQAEMAYARVVECG